MRVVPAARGEGEGEGEVEGSARARVTDQHEHELLEGEATCRLGQCFGEPR